MKEVLPCAIYTRKSSEEGLEQGFNSLDAQSEACEAYILSQKAQGWKAMGEGYDDGGFSGGNTDRPGLQKLLADIAMKKIRIVVVYKVDRLTRSLADFAKLVELFDAHGVSFVSVTQQFNTTSSMGRLTLNVLLSFAQFEREVTGERIRDKIAASKRKGMWMGGNTPVGYVPHERTLVIDECQAERVREIYRLYLKLGNVRLLKSEVDRMGWKTPLRETKQGNEAGGKPFSRGNLYRILSNPVYRGKISHKGTIFDGNHPAIVDEELWNAVQEKMKGEGKRHRSRSTAANPSLLTGLIFDDKGTRFTPTHSNKGAKRYRYYVTHDLITKGRGAAPDALRIPAGELEDAVLQSMGCFLKDESQLIGLMGTASTAEIKSRLHHAADLAGRLSAENPSERIELLKQLISRIIIYKDSIRIMVRIGGLWLVNHEPEEEEPTTAIEVPVRLKRYGMAVWLIVNAPGHASSRGSDAKMVALLAKAHDWFERLTSGRVVSINAIAKEEKVSSAYVTRVMYLAFLDPGIAQMILKGDHPLELNADRLMKMGPFPLSWNEQRVLLGMGC